ncbi:MAG TPA: hypothetical protein VEZ55_15380 [Chitinophagaceae bacterium]|jgi:hypothetical protein|nr:hypothetical protein [Chitinophagaceae bacterium]
MKEKLKDILSNLSTDVDQETLLLYLQGQLSPEQQHDLEKELLQNEFAADAMEGLKQVNDVQRMQLILDGLNRDLKKNTARKKASKEKLQMKQEPWVLISVVILLLLIIISYVVIHLYLRQ